MSKRKTWEIRSIHHAPITVTAPNWLAALGAALAELGMEEGLNRLACERLSSGLIIANDVSRRQRFTVRDVTVQTARPGRQARPAIRPRARATTREPAPRPEIPRGPYLDWMVDGLRSIH